MINLNINKDDQNTNDYLYCWDHFGCKPNKTVIHTTYLTSPFLEKISKYQNWVNNQTEIIPDEEDKIINERNLVKINDDIFISYLIIDKLIETSIVSEVVIYSKSHENLEEVDKLIEDLDECIGDFYNDEIGESNKLNTIYINGNGLDIEPINIELDLENIDSYYNTKTMKDINKSIKSIKKSERGILILNGERGTGKTSIVKYISNSIDRTVIFIPNNLIDQTINNPDFRSFLRRYNRPILVLDDCEMIFNDIFNKSNMVTNNLMQIIDGLIYKDVTVITIFNVDNEDEIDRTLTEANNLIDVIKFNYLEKDQANELTSIIKSNKKYKNDVKLIDVIKKKKSEEKSGIGF